MAVFFLITGFLFISKLLDKNRPVQWMKLYESRLFRIYPLYLFAVTAISIIVFHNTGYQIVEGAKELTNDYLKWLVFDGKTINKFEQTRLIIAGVDWTLEYEWHFYLSLPVIALILNIKRSIPQKVFLAIFVLLACLASKYFTLFVLGGCTAYLIKCTEYSEEKLHSAYTSLLSLSLLIGSLFYPVTLDPLHISLIALFFVFVAAGNNLFGLLKLNSAALLGEISYSIYPLHGLILYLLFTQFSVLEISDLPKTSYALLMPLISILVVLFSSMTFLLIEKPAIDYGKKYKLSAFITCLKTKVIRR